MFKKKPRRAFRQRRRSSDEEEQPETAGEEEEAGRRRPEAALSFSEDKEAEGHDFKLKKTMDKAVVFQPRRRPEEGSDSPRQVPDISASTKPQHQHDEDEDDEEEGGGGGGGDDDEDDEEAKSSPCSSLSSLVSSPAPSPVVIPDSQQIQAAKRQRRDARAQKDFLPLGRAAQGSPYSSPSPRDDDEEEEDDDDDDDDETDDHERRIEFAPQPKSIREQIIEKLGEDGASDSSEEEDTWEDVQIGKGLGGRPGGQSPSGSDISSSSSQRTRRQQKQQQKTFPESLPSVSISLVKKRILARLSSLKEVHRARQAELQRMEEDMESAQGCLEDLEGSSAHKQLKFYRSTAVYVHNLVECLREKVVQINSLELELHALLSEQTELLLAERRQAVRKEASRLQQLLYPTGKQSEASGEGETETGCQSVSLVSFGETETQCEDDVPEDRQPSAEEKEALERKKEAVLRRSQEVFGDVDEDYCDVSRVLHHFEEWRAQFPESYNSAYISLCLPRLLAPMVRLQLLAWNPLQASGGDVEALPWYTSVETFCLGLGYEEKDEMDTKTLSNVMERTLLPKMTAYAELVWDPLSGGQSVCLSDVCHRLREDHGIFTGEWSKPVKAFVEAVVSRLRSSVDEDVFVPLYPKTFLEERQTPQRTFRDQQFWSAVKLLGNMARFQQVVPDPRLQELMLERLLNRYLMVVLLNHNDPQHTVSMCRKVADRLPVSWLKGDVCLPQLRSFTGHLVQTADCIWSKPHTPQDATRAAVAEVLEVLAQTGAWDCVSTVAQKYQCLDLVPPRPPPGDL